MADRINEQELPLDTGRIIGFDLVRAVEAASLGGFKWLGCGDKIAADEAATDALRGMLNLIDMQGLCVIGEGIKDEAPGIFRNEKLGRWRPTSPRINFAIDPIDGTRLTAKGLPGAISVLAATVVSQESERVLAELPSFYSYKVAYGPAVREAGPEINLDAPLEKTLQQIADCLQKRLGDLVVALLDRPRHATQIAEIRKLGARIRLIGDGDVAMAIAPSMLNNTVDLYLGIGGSPEAVIAAAAIKCLGGEMLVRMWPRDESELAELKDSLWADCLARIYNCDDLAAGEDIIFAATGISDSPLLDGVVIRGQHAYTHSLLMRAQSRTVRYIQTIHDLSRKTIRLASEQQEHSL